MLLASVNVDPNQKVSTAENGRKSDGSTVSEFLAHDTAPNILLNEIKFGIAVAIIRELIAQKPVAESVQSFAFRVKLRLTLQQLSDLKTKSQCLKCRRKLALEIRPL